MTNEQLDALVANLSVVDAFVDRKKCVQRNLAYPVNIWTLRQAREAITALRARAEAAEADAERLAGALASVIAACRQARMTPKPGHGIGGMTIEANIRGSQYNGVSAWPIEEADEVLSAHNERMKG